jgi:hypothetical protein
MRDWVKAYCHRYELPSYDDALRHMKAALEGQDQDAVARAAAPQPPGDGEQPGKKQKREQLISWASFEGHDEILTYLTGLGKAERAWLVPKLENAVWAGVVLSSLVLFVQRGLQPAHVPLFVTQLDERPAKRGGSNSGWRQVDALDRVLLYFIQKRHGWSDYMLGIFFGVSDQSISNYVDEVASKVHGKFVPRLFFLPTPAEVTPYIPAEVRRLFPHALLIGDATHFYVDTPTKYSLNGLTFCVYKWDTTAQIVLCKASCVQMLCLIRIHDCFLQLQG